jgi:hypothetical protein
VISAGKKNIFVYKKVFTFAVLKKCFDMNTRYPNIFPLVFGNFSEKIAFASHSTYRQQFSL